MRSLFMLLFSGVFIIASGCQPDHSPSNVSDPVTGEPEKLRVATFNIEDVRTDDLRNPDHPRLKKIAAIVQQLRPDILLINEMAYDEPGGPGYITGEATGQNGQRFADSFLAVAQGPGLQPLHFQVVMRPSNTGQNSGYDLENNGQAVTTYPEPPPADADGRPGPQTPDGRAYGNDSWGFGTFPGQYAMAVFIRSDLRILSDQIRTFQHLPWSAMPGALAPVDPETDEPWYHDEEWTHFRLSSKTHMDVPVELNNGTVLHLLCSHPTPPAFDGDEGRNKRRNHDEIRFWADYLNNAGYIVDDAGQKGGFGSADPFVIMGDLNADPDEGSSVNNPIGAFLFSHERINGNFIPEAEEAYPDLNVDDTAGWGMRIDYVLPSMELDVVAGQVARPPLAEFEAGWVSDHFPVWVDVEVRH